MNGKKLSQDEVLKRIEEVRIVPVVVLEHSQDAADLANALIQGGINCAEVTFRTSAAADSIQIMKKEHPDMLVGAGTVLAKEQVDQAMDAGADFIVSPGLNADVVTFCQQNGIPIIPGVCSPSEIEKALELGLHVLKFFPAEASGGVGMLKALSAPYPMIRFLPTGGINEKNIKEYLNFHKVIACGGSWMVNKQLIVEQNFNEIEQLTRKAVMQLNQETDAKSIPMEAGSLQRKSEATSSGSMRRQSGRVVTFGEIMLRLAPFGNDRFIQTDRFEATYGGAEANVAVSLANYGQEVSFITKLPAHEIGQAAINSLRKYGVDTQHIVRGGNRVGIYYLEKGASQRPSKVIYDRAGSSFAESKSTEFDWERIFEGASWFHFTGITPALSQNMAETCLMACKVAKEKGMTVSCDLNYRKKLWSTEEANRVMKQLSPYIDICIANEEDASDVFGIHADNTDITAGQVNHSGYRQVAALLAEQMGFHKVAITLRESQSASDNHWSALLYNAERKEYYQSRQYAIHIVDRVGGGDSFGAGLIYALMNGYGEQDALEYAVAASCLKHSIEGDYNLVSAEEVLRLAKGDASGRVQR